MWVKALPQRPKTTSTFRLCCGNGSLLDVRPGERPIYEGRRFCRGASNRDLAKLPDALRVTASRVVDGLFPRFHPRPALPLSIMPQSKPLPVVMGVLTPYTGGFYYGTVMNGILTAARQQGAIAIAFETSRLRLKRGPEILASHWIDGWLAINEFHDPELLAELRSRGQHIVHVHAKPDVEHGASVLPDNAGGMRDLTQHLIDHGHRHIAFAGNLRHVDVGERYRGYSEAMEAAGLSVTDDLVFDTLHHKEEDGRNVAEQLLRRRERSLAGAQAGPHAVTALVACTDRLALGAMSAYSEAGLELPRDLAVVGFDDVDAAQFAEPPLTTVKQSFFEVAVRAVRELLGAIRGEEQLVPMIRVPTQAMVRRSCGCVVSHSMPPEVGDDELGRVHELTGRLLVQAGRNRVGAISASEWPEAAKIALSIDAAARGSSQIESVRGQWWSGYLAHNRDAESAVRVMELLEATLRAWDPMRINHHQVWGVLRDLRVALMHEWQRTERVMVAHYESVTEAAYRLANSLSSSGADPSHDLSWIRWSNPQRACCALWSDGGASMRPGARESYAPRPSAPLLRLTGEYKSDEGAIPTSPSLAALALPEFPPREILDTASEQGAMVTIAAIPRAREGEYGLLAVVAPLTFEQLEFVGTPGDWAVQLGAALDRAAAERELRASAELDALTGLANRATLLERVEALRASGACPGFALLFIDLDDFKKVNDSLGHLAGDQLLVQIAERLTSEVKLAHPGPHADRALAQLVARLGGDEFVVVLSEIDSEAEAVFVVERLQARLRQPFTLNGGAIFVSASIGVILGKGSQAGALELLRDADTAMYRAKVKGRARHEIFHHGMHKQALEKLHLDARLRLALEMNELELWYQPIMDLTTGSDVGAEALIRWRHPEQGLLSPARFLAVAEDVGLAIPFSEWVIRRACSEVAQFRQPNGRSLYVNVNVPAAHIKHPGFVQFVEDALVEYGLHAHSLGIEIVESTLLDEPEHCTAILSRLLALGVRIAIDDFGTGYSSLSYLRDFPASTLKIDRSFVMNVPGSSRDNGITRAIITMGQGLGLSLVAEGIETQEQLQFLIQAGCDFAQGYLISPPLELDDYLARLARFRPSEPPVQRMVRLAVR